MIRNSSRILRRFAAAGLLSIGVVTAHAQTSSTVTPVDKPVYTNALRLDVGGILARNVAYNALNSNPQVLLPILVGYERQLAPRFSGNAEVLLNGGEPDERAAGLALQGRYYAYQGRQSGLVGFYVAPTFSYRAIKQNPFYSFATEKRKLGGAGMLVGAQVPVGAKGRLLLDVSGGAMAWQRLDKSQLNTVLGEVDNQTYYERNTPVFDGRLSLGYRF